MGLSGIKVIGLSVNFFTLDITEVRRFYTRIYFDRGK
jgi:hypothetical protein